MRLSVPSLLLLVACSASVEQAPSTSPASAARLPVDGLNPGDIVISEIMQNPAAVSDTQGEWFEVYNATGLLIDLDGLVVSDSGGASFTVDDAVLVGEDGFAVFTRSATANGGVTGDYTFSGMSLTNGTDDLILSFDGLVLDQVGWDNGNTFPDPNGASMSLGSATLHAAANDAGANWCEAVTPYGDGDLGTPGAANDPCGGAGGLADLAPGDLLITEIMQNPAAVADYRGEWFEITNRTDDDVDLMGLEVTDAGGGTFTVGTSVVVGPGHQAVFTRNPWPALNGGVQGDYSWPATTFNLGNGSDSLTIEHAGITFDVVAWDNGATFPDPVGASMSLGAESVDAATNDDGAAWCEATSSFGAGDLGTPGAPNPGCGPLLTVAELSEGDLVITEVLQNPSAVPDAKGEWFEVLNDSGSTVDLDGLVVSDLGGSSFTVSTPLVVADGDYIVFARHGVSAENGGVSADYTWTTRFLLGNNDDEIVLSAGGVTFDQVAWDGGTAFPDPNGASMNLHDGALDAVDNDLGTAWCPSTVAFGDGDLGTPGAANTACDDGDGDGFTVAEGDCDDADPNRFPGAVELCDGLDGDCDTVVEQMVPDGGGVNAAIVAAPEGGLVCLAEGRFTEQIDFLGKDITVRGAGIGLTELDGTGLGPVVTFANGESSDAVLEDLTVRGGESTQGAGMYMMNASPTIRRVEVLGNHCVAEFTCEGAGAWLRFANATFEEVTFRSNSFQHDGGTPISTPYWQGGALYIESSTVSLTDVDIIDTLIAPWNSSTLATNIVGGAVALVNGTTVTMDRVNILGTDIAGEAWSSGGLYGGALSIEDSDVVANHLAINDGTVSWGHIDGGVVYVSTGTSFTLTNGIFAGNDAFWTLDTVKGGVIYVADGGANATLTNVSVIGNAFLRDVSQGGSTDGHLVWVDCRNIGGSTFTAHNTSFYANGDGTSTAFEGGNGICDDEITLSYVNEGLNGGTSMWLPANVTGAMSVDPAFQDDASPWDLTLRSHSQLIDAGDPAILDADGSRSDVGAHGGPGSDSW